MHSQWLRRLLCRGLPDIYGPRSSSPMRPSNSGGISRNRSVVSVVRCRQRLEHYHRVHNMRCLSLPCCFVVCCVRCFSVIGSFQISKLHVLVYFESCFLFGETWMSGLRGVKSSALRLLFESILSSSTALQESKRSDFTSSTIVFFADRSGEQWLLTPCSEALSAAPR